MSGLQVTMIVLCFTIPLLGWVLLFRQIYRYVTVFQTGAPDPTRTDRPGARTWTLIREVLGHTRMSRLPVVAVAHWFTMIAFGFLFLTLVNAFFQLFRADFALPLIGHFPPYEWFTEVFAWGGLIGIIVLMLVRQKAHPRNAAGEHGRGSRFFGSTFWQAYYVELTILAVLICVLSLRTLEYQLAAKTGADNASLLHFPLTAWMSGVWAPLSVEWIEESIYVVAAIKILISFAWMITIALQPTMGVAWHRFLAFFNIWFKRNADGRTALGPLKPIVVNGTPLSAATLEDVMESEDDPDGAPVRMGVGKLEDFTWKGLLDFTTCTECGRCQSQCPAWNTDKPLSPKMLVMTLRDHTHAKYGLLTAPADERDGLPAHTRHLDEMPLVGKLDYKADFPLTAYDALGPDAVIDEDVLWSCTTCGACVEQCPVDIEHVDEIMDLRRHQVLIESSFPAEFGSLFKNMESKGNPWGMSPKARMDWAKGLDFDIPVVGQDVDDLSGVDYLFWVGCAGALEDRAKKTTRAVAELLETAGVSFAVLGDGESCTGDSARRAGNEILYQMLAAQNVEMLDEAGATKIVVTCAHCFNTIKNEYPQIGGNYEVVHHTQLLNRLVRDKKLVPVSRPAAGPVASSSKDAASSASTVTYHDPCYLGRHNNVYAPPRELIGSLPGVELREMPRHGMTSFCCGAGGARMWAEEKLGTRVNVNRTAEAVATGADRIAIGCPFCRVMLTDGLVAAQSEGTAREEVEVVDIAQMLLAAVRRGEEPEAKTAPVPTEARPAAGTTTEAADLAGATAAVVVEAESRATDEVVAPNAERAPSPQPVVMPEPAESKELAPAPEVEPEIASEPVAAPEPAVEKAAPAPKGKMSAAEALAAMGATPAAPAQAAAAPARTTPAPALEETEPVAPKGKMSAAEALAAMGATPAAPAKAPATPVEAASAAAAPQIPAAVAPTPATSAEAVTPAPAEAVTSDPVPAIPATPAAPTGKVAIPTGKMTATEALELLGGSPAPATPDAPTAPAVDTTAVPGPAPAQAAVPVAEAEAPVAPAAVETPALEAVTKPAEPGGVSASSPVATPVPAAPTAPAASTGQITIPTGKMTATQALELLGGVGTTAETAPAEATAAPARIPAAPAETAQLSAQAPVTPAEDATVEETAAPPAAAAPAEAPALRSETAVVGDAAVPAAPAPAAPPASAAPASMPTGRMTAAEALAAMSALAGATTAPAAASVPDSAAAPSAAQVTEKPVAKSRDAEPPAKPGSAAPAIPSAAAGPSPVEAPKSAPVPEAPASTGTPAATAAAWQKVLDTAAGKPIAASEVLKLLVNR